MDALNILGFAIQKVVEVMKIEFSINGFVVSLWSVFIGVSLATLALWFVRRIFD